MSLSAIPAYPPIGHRVSIPLRIGPGIITVYGEAGGTPRYRRHSQCLVAQRRSFFGWGRRGYWQHDFDRRCQRAMNQADRLFYKNARKIGRSHNWYRIPFPPQNHMPPRAWRRSRNVKDGNNASNDKWPSRKWAQKSWFDDYDAECHRVREFEQVKRAIDSDPYGMLFGRRLHPFGFQHTRGPWSMFLSSFFGPTESGQDSTRVAEKPGQRVGNEDTKGNSPPQSDDEVLFKFDPVAGRMVPKESAAESKEDLDSKTDVANDPVKKPTPGVEFSGAGVELANSRTQDTPKDSKQLENTGDTVEKHKETRPSETSLDADNVEGKNTRENNVTFTREPHERSETSSTETDRGDDVSDVAESKASAINKEYSRPKFSRLEDIRDDQPSRTTSWARSSQALFSNFKEYITSTLETDDQKEAPDTHRWPTLDSSKSKTGLKDDSISRLNHRKNPEADELETLRASDVRASFQQRETEQDNEMSARRASEEVEENMEEPIRLGRTKSDDDESATANDPAKPDQFSYSSAFDPEHSDEDQGSNRSASSEPEGTASLSTEPNNETLEDTIRQIYEESYGKISPVTQGHATGETGDVSEPSQTQPETAKSAALVTDSLSMAGPMLSNAAELSSTDTRERPISAASDESSLGPPQREKLDRLLADIDRVNTETPKLLQQFQDSIDGMVSDIDDILRAASIVDTKSGPQYKLLSHDSLAGEVKEASILSESSVPFGPLHPADAIGRLHCPSKFLPYFAELEDQGYELFSGGPEVLIFKNTRAVADRTAGSRTASEVEQLVRSLEQASKLKQESVDQAKSGSDGLQSAWDYPKSDTSSSSSSSHSSEKNQTHPFLRKVTRRMFLTGVITGGTFYAIGVVAEYFRTGGSDGLGPQGFTGLEGR